MSQSTATLELERTEPVCPRPAARRAEADVPLEEHVFQAVFRPHLSMVADMRLSTAAVLRRAGLPRLLIGNVVLSVSELVTNAIEHGRGVVKLVINVNDDIVRVSVIGKNPAPAVLRQARLDDTSGRGLLLVQELADAWGSEGQETWCEFRRSRKGSAA
ncbi:ATP-binding protein [Streptomyces sp. LaPpAH-108]|uniref:ATP-binding protein n=1 Tax=Streptomyces sp. LaPpAH-108 TaxID=1155714 RepID=UPI00037C7A41|nr:ATP-binding protein [Streptomyces sp. LaPpAH-108]